MTAGPRVLRTLPELLDAAVTTNPAAEVVFPGERATWTAVARRARAFASGLAAAGVGGGDRVLVVLPGGLDAVVAIVGSALLGALPTPLNPRGTADETAWLRADADPAAVVATDELGGLAGPGWVLPAAVEAAGVGGGVDRAPVTPDDPMILLYTSGTTSRPRGCVHTHGAYAAMGENLVDRLRLTPADRFWTPLPLHHCGGIDLLLGSLAAACTLLHVGAFTPGAAVRQLVDERATVAFPAFDTIWLPVLDGLSPAAVPELRTVINVGPAERMAGMQERLPTAVQISCLGGTEAAGFCCVGSVDDPPAARAGTSGVPLPGMEARVVDPATGRECGPGDIGEFLHRGVSRMAYYHRDPATTAERIDDDGWFHTGDLVRRDAEGRYTFVSRLKDMLKVGGENVAAAEVEGRLATHPTVGVVAVVGAPDARLGEVAAAFVELTPAARRLDRAALTTELQAHCAEALATFKVPRWVEFVETWPMSGTKVQKAVLRERIAGLLAERGIVEAPRLSRQALVG